MRQIYRLFHVLPFIFLYPFNQNLSRLIIPAFSSCNLISVATVYMKKPLRFASGQERLDKLLRFYFNKLGVNFSNVHIYIIPNLPSAMSNGTIRANIKEGTRVGIVLKEDQRTGKITQGVVKRILTNSSNHPHGIKVQLTNGQVGRVKEIYSEVK